MFCKTECKCGCDECCGDPNCRSGHAFQCTCHDNEDEDD